VILVKLIYKLTGDFPKTEQFGLTNQLRRASISIPSNIAEGYGRRTKQDRDHFFFIAFGSALEVETQLIIARDLDFASSNKLKSAEETLLEVIKMLNSLTLKSR
jgi:four helix bundle protein